MYSEAYAKCRLLTGDDDSSGGCAIATSFGVAFADACAAATAEAFATVDGKSCDCDIGYYVDAVAWAVEYKCAPFRNRVAVLLLAVNTGFSARSALVRRVHAPVVALQFAARGFDLRTHITSCHSKLL